MSPTSPAPTSSGPTPSLRPSFSNKLSWAPPQLNDKLVYDTRDIPEKGLVLPDSQDVEIRSGTMDYPLVIDGGRNIVCKGVTVNVPGADSGRKDEQRRGVYLKNQSGVVHMEGLFITGAPTDGFVLDQRKGATVQIQLTRVEGLVGTPNGNHADGIQSWGGPRNLYVDRFSVVTNYQGVFLQPSEFEPVEVDAIDLRRVDIDGSSGGSYLLWIANDVDRSKVHLSEVYLKRVQGSAAKQAIPDTVFDGVNLDVLPSTSFAPREMVGADKYMALGYAASPDLGL